MNSLTTTTAADEEEEGENILFHVVRCCAMFSVWPWAARRRRRRRWVTLATATAPELRSSSIGALWQSCSFGSSGDGLAAFTTELLYREGLRCRRIELSSSYSASISRSRRTCLWKHAATFQTSARFPKTATLMQSNSAHRSMANITWNPDGCPAYLPSFRDIVYYDMAATMEFCVTTYNLFYERQKWIVREKRAVF